MKKLFSTYILPNKYEEKKCIDIKKVLSCEKMTGIVASCTKMSSRICE